MALRSSAQLKSFFNQLTTRGARKSGFATSAIPKMKPHSPTTDIHSHGPDKKFWRLRGEFAPVYVALGMIVMSMSFGINTAMQQLKRGPNIYVKKSRRETVPEVVEPEKVAEEADQFVNKSFFRKVAHIQDYDRQDVISDPLRGDVYARKPKTVTLKDVGVEPPKNIPTTKDVQAYWQRH